MLGELLSTFTAFFPSVMHIWEFFIFENIILRNTHINFPILEFFVT